MRLEELNTIVEVDMSSAITVRVKGNFNKIDSFFEKAKEGVKIGKLDKYGKMGVDALAANTPKNTGKTAASWDYRIDRKNGETAIQWFNTNRNDGVCVAIVIQYGHVANGTYVRGVDYINPAMRPVFDEIADGVWKEVTGERNN